jgi:peptidyl-prolyl cis-trans isomerase B (cyclophilin B)
MFRPLCAAGLATALFLSLGAPGTVHGDAGLQTAPAPAQAPVIVIETAKGVIEIETFPADAPKSVAHFVELARKGFYRGLRFHWVQPGLVQAGDPLSRDITKQKDWGTGGSGPGRSNKPNGFFEPTKRKFERGIVALAYRPTWKPETADSMFFILLAAAPALEGKDTALGRVIKGLNVADKVEMNDILKNVTDR